MLSIALQRILELLDRIIELLIGSLETRPTATKLLIDIPLIIIRVRLNQITRE